MKPIADPSRWTRDLQRRASDTLKRTKAHPPEPVLGAVTLPELAKMIDSTLLRADSTYAMIDKLCADGRQHGFAALCVNSCHVARCARALQGSPVLVASVTGFPLGAMSPQAKACEATQAIEDGAREMDMVLNIGAFKSGDYALVAQDIAGVVDVCHAREVICKVILETAVLSDEDKVLACLLATEAGADFVKTSTGFAAGGATAADVALMRAVVGPDVGVKAAGGIRDYATAMAMVRAGANRIGTSAGVAILQGVPV